MCPFRVIPASQCSRHGDLLPTYLSCSHTLFLFLSLYPSFSFFLLHLLLSQPKRHWSPSRARWPHSTTLPQVFPFFSPPLCLSLLSSLWERGKGLDPLSDVTSGRGRAEQLEEYLILACLKSFLLSITSSSTALRHQPGVFTHSVVYMWSLANSYSYFWKRA